MSITQRFRNKLFIKKNIFPDFSSFNSRTTNLNTEENIKKKKNKIVYFNSVEIIDVESYKEYNKLDTLTDLETSEKNNSKKCEDCNCILF